MIISNKPKEEENSNSIDSTHITANADIVPETNNVDLSIEEEDLSNNPEIIWV